MKRKTKAQIPNPQINPFSKFNMISNINLKNVIKVAFLELLPIALIFYFSLTVNKINSAPLSEFNSRRDITLEYYTSLDILVGRNPYNRIGNDLLRNKKYATLLPLYYFTLSGIMIASNFVFSQFINNFRTILFVFELVGGFFIYLIFRKHKLKLLGFMACAFYILNRWNIDNIHDLKQDVIAIAFIMASLYFFNKKQRLSYLLYGMSVGIKHIGIFIFPIYLTPLLFKERSVKDFLVDVGILLLPIVGPALPYLLDNPVSFIFSMLFSFTRAPVSNGTVPFGYDKILTMYNPTGLGFLTIPYYMLPRLPLIIFTLCNIYLLIKKAIPRSFYVFSALLIFVTFNPVIFDQYNVWLTPLFFYSITDFIKTKEIAKA